MFTNVFIFGARPTGVKPANQLTRRGVPHTIIDRQSESAQQSRAMVAHARSLETVPG